LDLLGWKKGGPIRNDQRVGIKRESRVLIQKKLRKPRSGILFLSSTSSELSREPKKHPESRNNTTHFK